MAEFDIGLICQTQFRRQVLLDLREAVAEQSQVTARFTAAEGRSLKQKAERCPDPDVFDRTPGHFNLIDYEPKTARTQSTDLRNRGLDRALDFGMFPAH